jgi:hypothetical protein
MKFLCALSVTLRLAVVAFVVGLVVGLMVGYQAVGSRVEPGQTPTTAMPLLVNGSPWFTSAVHA